jgi:hypothetical protein
METEQIVRKPIDENKIYIMIGHRKLMKGEE